MFAPHAVDTAVIISSLIASLCFTFAEPFDDEPFFVKSSCALVSGNTNKSLRPIDRPNDQASEFALAHLTPILHSHSAVVKMVNERVRKFCIDNDMSTDYFAFENVSLKLLCKQ